MSDIIDVIGPQGGVVEVSAESIAALIQVECHVKPHIAARTANKIIDYLVRMIEKAEGEKPQ